jgi:hypothetical protein
MNLRFSDHAKAHLFGREISTEDIKSVIRNPDSYYLSFDNRIVARKRILVKAIEIEVVYTKAKNQYKIITIYER